MDTCSKINGGLDVWTWRYWSSVWVTRLERPKGMKYKVKRPELRKASTKMSAPSRAPRLQYHHIVVFVRGRRGEGRKREGGKSWKVWKLW